MQGVRKKAQSIVRAITKRRAAAIRLFLASGTILLLLIYIFSKTKVVSIMGGWTSGILIGCGVVLWQNRPKENGKQPTNSVETTPSSAKLP